MSGSALQAHLALGVTTVCRAWTLHRQDGLVMGFTDHDRDLVVDGVPCRAASGLGAGALQQVTGLAVDNIETIGALSDAGITEEDIAAGRFDRAEVRGYLVNWARPEECVEQFRGSFGEVTRAAGAFRAELRGLSEALNQPQGLAFQPGCSAVLGDGRCRFDTSSAGFLADCVAASVKDGRVFEFDGLGSFADRWFEHGRFEVRSGSAEGLVGVVKSDRMVGAVRQVELWQSIRAEVRAGDMVRIIAGCSKTAVACREKFNNFINFRGFPHIPGEDWLASYPVPARPAATGSRVSGVTR